MAGSPAPASAAGQRSQMSAWAPLRHRVYRMLWLAQFVSNIGTFMQGVGAVWVMLELRQSPAVVALVQTAVALPVLLLGVPAGALADLTDRRRLLLATQGLMLAAAAALAVLTWAGSVTPKRDRAHAGTSWTKSLSCAANRSGSNLGEYSWSRSVSSAARCTPTIMVEGTSTASRTLPH